VPYAAREWFIKYADRIVFGTDITPLPDMYRVHYRFLETADEYFPYTTEPRGGQGRFNIYGVFLPDDVLEKVYNGNFHRLVGV